jgi:hypothetical protein
MFNPSASCTAGLALENRWRCELTARHSWCTAQRKTAQLYLAGNTLGTIDSLSRNDTPVTSFVKLKREKIDSLHYGLPHPIVSVAGYKIGLPSEWLGFLFPISIRDWYYVISVSSGQGNYADIIDYVCLKQGIHGIFQRLHVYVISIYSRFLHIQFWLGLAIDTRRWNIFPYSRPHPFQKNFILTAVLLLFRSDEGNCTT